MKIMIALVLVWSVTSFAQTRVKENIKTQALDSSVEEQPKPAPVKKPRKVK